MIYEQPVRSLHIGKKRGEGGGGERGWGETECEGGKKEPQPSIRTDDDDDDDSSEPSLSLPPSLADCAMSLQILVPIDFSLLQ